VGSREQEALQTNTPRQMRLLFLMHNWAAVLDYKKEAMEQAINLETTLKVIVCTRAQTVLRHRALGVHWAARPYLLGEAGLAWPCQCV
jgi:cysteinyl-tRNA synthetase